MAKAKIYHNPRCSKSRQTLALLQEKLSSEDLEVVEYLKHPLTERQLRALSKKLGLEPKDFIRQKEAEFTEQGLKAKLEDAAALYAAIAATPKLMERPIVVVGERAAIGRPPERVLDLL